MENKKCKECDEIKPYSEFYPDKTMKTGCINYCKPCALKRRKPTSLKNRDKLLNAKRLYSKTDRAKKLKKDWYSTAKGKAYLYKVVKNFRDKNPEKTKAHRIVRYAVKNGIIKKQPCSVCNIINHVHAHHDDYTKPLNVIWLCAKHHNERHRELKMLNNQTNGDKYGK